MLENGKCHEGDNKADWGTGSTDEVGPAERSNWGQGRLPGEDDTCRTGRTERQRPQGRTGYSRSNVEAGEAAME